MHLVKWQRTLISSMIALLANAFLGASVHASSAVTTLATLNSPSTLVEGPDRNFYGTTASGGATVFQMTPQGVVTTLHSFTVAEGSNPTGLVLASDGNLYGSAEAGGANGTGTVFKITTTGEFTVIYSFPLYGATSLVGGLPTQLTAGTDGRLYGMSEYGGMNSCGTVFSMTLEGVPTALYSFPVGGGPIEGGDPMTLGSDGYLYGVSNQGLFRVSTGGSFVLLSQHAGTEGLTPVLGNDGNLYGTMEGGGTNGGSSIYKFAGGALTTLYSFPVVHPYTGIAPSSLIDGGDSYFYGTTNVGGQSSCACGQIFKISSSGTFVSAYYFDGVTAADPTNRLIRGTDGYFYGTTAGSIYRFDSTAPPPPVITLTSNTPAIALGSSATLSWSAVNATSCAASNAWTGSFAVSGSLTVTPTALNESDYTLTCTGSGGTAVMTYPLQVETPASASISISPSTINIAQSAVVSWSSNYPCVATGAWSGAQPSAGTLSVSPRTGGSYLYTLTCSGEGTNVATASVTLTVNPLPTVTISASAASIVLGSSFTLTWSAINATSCLAADAWSGSVGTAGTQSFTPGAAGNYMYTLTCTGVAGTTSNSVAILAYILLPTVTFAANPASVTLGQGATLAWSSTNAASCTAGDSWGGSVSTAGSQSVTPGAVGDLTYSLSCTGAGGTTTASTIVNVTSAPITTGGTPAPTGGNSGGGGALSWASLIGLSTLAATRIRRRKRDVSWRACTEFYRAT